MNFSSASRLLFRAADVELRHPVVFRIEPVGVDGAEIFDRVVGALARRALGDPERLEVAGLLIERDDGVAVGLARDHAVELLAGDDLANLGADLGLGRGVGRGRFHGCGPGRRGSGRAAGAGAATGRATGSTAGAGTATGRDTGAGGGSNLTARLRRGDARFGLGLGAGLARARASRVLLRARDAMRVLAGASGVAPLDAGSVPRKRMPSSIIVDGLGMLPGVL